MPPYIANLVFALGIWGLFTLDRDRKARTSKALWIPVLWLLINGSRPVSQWLGIAGFGDARAVNLADQYMEGSPVDRLVFTILLAAGLVVLISRGRQVGALLRRNGPILLFFAYCGVSVLWSDYPFVAFKRWTKGIGDVLMVLVVLTEADRSSAVKRLLARASFVLVPLSVLFIKYYPDLGRSYNPWSWTVMYSGIMETKNELGMVCLVLGLGSVWRCASACLDFEGWERTRRLIAHGTIVAMVTWLLVMADSMTSLSCFIMASGLIAVTGSVRLARKPAVLHLMIAAIVCVSFSVLFLNVGGGALETMGRDATLTGRTIIWHAVLSVTGNPLLGCGYESFWLGARLQKVWTIIPGIQEAHDGYLEVYLNLGWIGVTLLAVVIVMGYRNVVRAFRRDPGGGLLRVVFFVACVVYNFTEAGFRMTAPVWFAFLLATMDVPDAVRKVRPRPASNALESSPTVSDNLDHLLCVGSGKKMMDQ